MHNYIDDLFILGLCLGNNWLCKMESIIEIDKPKKDWQLIVCDITTPNTPTELEI